MTNKWLIWLTCALLFISGWSSHAGASLALDQESSIQVATEDEMMTISGTTDPQDPAWVPLIVKDASGQILYFQDVPGAGKPFQIEVEIPNWAEYGTAEAVLFSTIIAKDRFSIDNNQGGKKKMDVSIRIVGEDGDEILKRTSFSVSKQSSVYNLLRVAAEENGLDYEVRDPENDGEQVYLISIDGLAEFDKGPGSGWVYKVNGTGPQTSIDRYKLSAGDRVEFLYTTDLGKSESVGNGNSGAGSSYEVSTSFDVSSAISQLEFAEDVDSIVSIAKKLIWDLSDYSIEKQQTFVPDVAVFLQAAYEHAARLPEKKSEVTKPLDPDIQDVSGIKVTEALQDQVELKKELDELLENSTLYKPLLKQLKPVLLVPYPTNSTSQVIKLYIDRNSRDKLRSMNTTIAMVKGDLRANLQLLPESQSGSESMWVSVRAYTDQEQTTQFNEWQSSTDLESVPLTGSYRVETSHPTKALVELSVPITGSVDELSWPTLFERTVSTDKWSPVVAELHRTKQRISVPVKFGTDVVVVQQSHAFEDVLSLDESNRKIQEAIAALYGWGIVQGTSSTSFGTDQTLNRAEFFALLNRLDDMQKTAQLKEKTASSSTTQSAQTPVFSDVPADSWYAPVVKAAVLKGWTLGRNQTMFAPQASMSRAEVAVLIARLYDEGSSVDTKTSVSVKDEVAIPSWASDAVGVAAARQWLLPDANGNIRSNENITRGEAAYAIYRYVLDKYIGDDK